MGRPARDITESELAVLRILWDRGLATIRQVTEVLYPDGGAAQYATVQKLLDRMEAKAFVRRDRSLFVHRFVPVLDRDELIGRRLRSLAETLCDGSLTPLLTHLARAGDLTDDDRRALRAIIEESASAEEGEEAGIGARRYHGPRRSSEVARGPDRPQAFARFVTRSDRTVAGRPSTHGIPCACHAEQRPGRDRAGRWPLSCWGGPVGLPPWFTASGWSSCSSW